MLKYDRIDVFGGIDVNKIDGWCEFIICYYWYIPGINFRFHPKVCDCFHDLIQKATSFNDGVIVSVKL